MIFDHPYRSLEVIFAFGNDQQYLWSGVLQGNIGCLLSTYLLSNPFLDQSLAYKWSGSFLIGSSAKERRARVEWLDSQWECMQPCLDLLCEEFELIVEDKQVT